MQCRMIEDRNCHTVSNCLLSVARSRPAGECKSKNLCISSPKPRFTEGIRRFTESHWCRVCCNVIVCAKCRRPFSSGVRGEDEPGIKHWRMQEMNLMTSGLKFVLVGSFAAVTWVAAGAGAESDQ